MNIKWTHLSLGLAASFVLACSHPQSLAASNAPAKPTMPQAAPDQMQGMTAEMHDKLAAMHRDVASCLRAGKPREECTQIMVKAHESMCRSPGGQGCDGMGMSMMGREEK